MPLHRTPCLQIRRKMHDSDMILLNDRRCYLNELLPVRLKRLYLEILQVTDTLVFFSLTTPFKYLSEILT